MSARCRLVFLGGLGEVGRNIACLEIDDDVLVLDAGLSFPTEDMPGVDLVLPDYQYLRERQDRIAGVVLTHGHEDHMGALPYILKEIALEIWAPPLALGLLRPKLEEHGVTERATLHELRAGDEARVGPFTVRAIRVTHSIPEGLALAIDTPFGTVLHSGDFRLDPTPVDGRATDLQAFGEEGRRGVHVFLSDSTNAEDPGIIPSERTVGPELLRIFEGASRRVVAACFSSHIHRIQQICDAALAVGRRIAFFGRSMHHAVAQARELGHLHVPEDAILDIEEIAKLPPEQVAVICTGSQGEPLSALSLMAAREHKWVKLEEGDTVVIAASLIPGNEVAIHRTIDGLFRTGADVFHTGIAHVHVSGHAAAEELKFMLGLVTPRWFIPIHGERRHLSHHAKLAREVGIPDERILICEDGDVVEIGEKVEVVDRVEAGMVLVDGLGIGDVGAVVLRDRRKLAGDGVVIVVVTADAQSGELLAGPDIVTRGFVHDESSAEMLEEARRRTRESLEAVAREEVGDPAILKQHVRRTLGRYFFEVTKRKPVILPVIMEV